MTLHRIKTALYALYLTNKFGFKLRGEHSPANVTKLRLDYSETLLSHLKININVEGKDKITAEGPYLIVSNHRSIIDPLIVEMALKNSGVNGLWVAKKELYNSFFFGMFTRNAGTVLLDRESKTMTPFFNEVKKRVKSGYSICVFAEGTRNQTTQTLAEFKEGAQIIAMKNRLPILPVYIKTNADEALESSLKNTNEDLTASIIIGDIIDYKDRSDTLQAIYKSRFNLD